MAERFPDIEIRFDAIREQQMQEKFEMIRRMYEAVPPAIRVPASSVWLDEIQKLVGKKIEHAPLENRPAEKIEPAPGKRKIVL